MNLPLGQNRADRGPWNPGIESALPRAFVPLSTVFRPENISTSIETAQELSAFLGLSPQEIVAFRAQRLVVHEILIRVMTELSVPVGNDYADLGVNFREIVTTILSRHVDPHRLAIERGHNDLVAAARDLVSGELSSLLAAAYAPPVEDATRSWRQRFGLRRASPSVERAGTPEYRATDFLADLDARSIASGDRLRIAASAALRTIITSVIRHRGALVRDQTLLTELATTLIANREGSRRIGEMLEPMFADAVQREGYVRVGVQTAPVVMTVKGASASGKSTMRPLQRALVERIGANWSDFAVITPDIWRKYLLDYDAIGPAFGYAGTLTAHEVEIIDRKLDAYMARKANDGRMSHLLIDRFRFDSFSADSAVQDGSQLLTRFGRDVYMQFMVTPPEATVERAWKRGERFGRYKSVDDLLAHNIEAFEGIPNLFFIWACRTDKQVHYEFLDNSVALGERPLTIAFGTNRSMVVLRPSGLLDIERFKKINVDARSPETVYPDAGSLRPDRNINFIRECARRLTSIRFAEPSTGRVYAHFRSGHLAETEPVGFELALNDDQTLAALAAIEPSCAQPGPRYDLVDEVLSPADGYTVGAWGQA